ncbi:rhodanese-like domain-containing protein [Hydrogenovibrio sp. JE_KL2]|uniref:rhodanese-like domain-containing protein n=1 Tax=Hydrogenovibrio sp. JE_KL2 TaxID=2651188 RepID=UPI00128B6206|nr:rhodanese-like domain-containing protein [Hydrogenovibrio sp. JE_KL2]MPQ77302.1 sulfurtransferase [Hydrogenovibrio sp. JE_KL2]
MIMKKLLLTFAAVTFALSSVSAFAAPTPSSKKKQTTLGLYASPHEAYEMKKKGGEKVLFIDVRTPAELEFVGVPTDIDKNIPLVYRDFSKYDAKKKRFATVKNKNFVKDVEALAKKHGIGKDGTIIFMCRSGDRSAVAVNMMAKAGYTHAYTLVGGFQGGPNKADHGKRNKVGWMNDNLPFTQKLNKNILDLQ